MKSSTPLPTTAHEPRYAPDDEGGHVKDYTPPADETPVPPDPITLHGQTFAFRASVPGGLLWRLLAPSRMLIVDALDLFRAALVDDDGTGPDDPKTGSSRERFLALIEDPAFDTPPATLQEIVEDLTAHYYERPTVAPSSSPDGGARTGSDATGTSSGKG